MAVASLVLGILSIPVSLVPVIGYPFCIAGFVSGRIGMKRGNRLSIAGMVVSALGLIATNTVSFFLGANPGWLSQHLG
jgi:hypothetical protein